MRTIAALLMLVFAAACSENDSGPAACVAAGGQCVIGGGGNTCPNAGPQDCNPDRNPGGAFCCLPCPQGTKPNDGGTACE
jgi:hypothetical protein